MDRKSFSFRLKYRDELRRVILALSKDPSTSESISSPNGGSRSVSHANLASLTQELRSVESEIDNYKRSILGMRFDVNYARWCW